MVWEHFGRRYPRAREFLARRLDAGEYLGLHLTLGLVLGVAALGSFAVLAGSIAASNGLTEMDETLKQQLHLYAWQDPQATAVVKAVTTLGNTHALTLLSLIVATVLVVLMLVHRCHYTLPAIWLTAALGANMLIDFLKGLFERPRPAFADPVVPAGGFSFPSGHALGSLVIYGMLAYVLVLAVPARWARALIITFTALLVLAVGGSRIYLGVHWFSDVVGGFAAGTVWLALCITMAELVRRREAAVPKPCPEFSASAGE
jgi:undecaprenyl-diphosphatase